MWEFFSAVWGSMGEFERLLVMGFMLIATTVVLYKFLSGQWWLTRNKQGRLRIYNQKFESQQTMYKSTSRIVKDWQVTIGREVEEIHQQLRRLQILDLINHKPENVQQIIQLYDLYKAKGEEAGVSGNGYIDVIVGQWKLSDSCKKGLGAL